MFVFGPPTVLLDQFDQNNAVPFLQFFHWGLKRVKIILPLRSLQMFAWTGFSFLATVYVEHFSRGAQETAHSRGRLRPPVLWLEPSGSPQERGKSPETGFGATDQALPPLSGRARYGAQTSEFNNIETIRFGREQL